jgi:circadian clock protein KaiB
MRAKRAPRMKRYMLRLYVTGATPHSVTAISRIKAFCEENLKDRYDLEVIDIYQRPQLARDEQILAIPTLIRTLPDPLRQFIGDLAKLDRILLGADLRKYNARNRAHPEAP